MGVGICQVSANCRAMRLVLAKCSVSKVQRSLPRRIGLVIKLYTSVSLPQLLIDCCLSPRLRSSHLPRTEGLRSCRVPSWYGNAYMHIGASDKCLRATPSAHHHIQRAPLFPKMLHAVRFHTPS